MSTPLELSIHQIKITDGVRRILTLRNTGENESQTQEFFFDVIGEFTEPEPEVLDGFVLAVIFIAMQAGRPLRIHGKLSRTGCYNISEFQNVWVSWRPNKYQRVQLVPDEIVDIARPSHPPIAISAFSGGVDGSFTAIRHRKKILGNASYPLTDVMMVHGFDVPLDKPEAFNLLIERIQPLLDELKLNLRVIRTNLKESSGQTWEDSFGAQLAACFHNFSNSFSFALMGNDEPYTDIVYPWGSTPMTNHLLSGDKLSVIIDGADYTRTEKVEKLLETPVALQTLKVCWEGNNQERNCGHCEKCIRTKMNLLAVGVHLPPCFEEPLDPREILKIPIRNNVQLAELETIYRYAKNHNLSGEWLDNLFQRIKNQSPTPRFGLERIARNFLARFN